MTSFTGLAIGLSLVFVCLLLGLFAELYYLLWYKKNRGIEDHRYTKYIKSIPNVLCFQTKPGSKIDPKSQPRSPKTANCDELTTDPELGLPRKGFGDDGLDSELIRIHNLCGPPRFLFPIIEETKEDLESSNGRSRGERSLGGFSSTVETPVFTPLASPRSFNHNGFNFDPLVGKFTEAEVNRVLSSPRNSNKNGFNFNPMIGRLTEAEAPPSKFKFLRDAEEKWKRKLMIEEAEKIGRECNPTIAKALVTLSSSQHRHGHY